MLELAPKSKLALSSSILLRSVPARDLYYAFDVVSGDQFVLNRTSYWILEATGAGIEWEELRARFLQTFDVAPEPGISDLADTVAQSLREGIVRGFDNGQEAR